MPTTVTTPAITDEGPSAACCTWVATPEITPEQAGTLASLFKALADPHRIRIVNLLVNAEAPVCVCEFMPLLGLAQPTVSFHLAKLRRVGLIERQQRGTWAYYSLNRSALGRLAEVLDPEGGSDD
jgi:ArsR family transcriptional regulator, arsenate/arsenite/antimonite-responsive transcriptional repressor